MMKKIAVLTALLLVPTLLIGPTPAAAKDTSNAKLKSQIDQILREAYPADAPGATAIVVDHGKTLLRSAYGMADLEHSVALEPDTVFRIGSITKQFTAVGIMMLAEEGKLSVDDDITRHLTDYPAPKTSGGQETTVTIEHLLTHTSGIPSYTNDPELMAKAYEPYTVDEMLDVFKDRELEFEPGSKFAYDNSGYFLLGAIIEKISGQSYADFIQERIFEPLGMERSYYDEHGRIIADRARGYHRGEDGFVNAPYISMTIPYAAGSLLSTVDDLVLWNAALNTNKLLPRKALRRMWTGYKLTDGENTGYGYGWAVGEQKGSPVIHHSGGIHGFSTMGIRLPDRDAYIAILSNNPQGGQNPGLLAQNVAAALTGDLSPVAVEMTPEALKRYVGVYQISETEERVFALQDGQPYTQRTGGGKSPLQFSSPTEFFYKDTLARGRFEIGDGDKVKGMTMKEWSQPGVFAAWTDKPIPEGPKIAEVDPAIYDDYEGRFELMANFFITIRRDGDRLMTQAVGQQEFEVFPTSETEFFNETIGGQLTFVRDEESGKVLSFILRQGGQEMTAKRVE